MAHARFAQIPMSKRMRDLCKEEDYSFLESQRDQNQPAEKTCIQSPNDTQPDERVRRLQRREKQEQEKQREREEQQQKEREKWKSHVAELAAQREAVHAKLHRLREFRDFQKQVLLQDMGLDPGSENETVNHLLTRL